MVIYGTGGDTVLVGPYWVIKSKLLPTPQGAKLQAAPRCKHLHCAAAAVSKGSCPIGSMYGIYANIWGILMVNVTIYSIHGFYGCVGRVGFKRQTW